MTTDSASSGRRMMVGHGKAFRMHPADPHIEDEWCLQMLCETTCRGEHCGHIARKHFPIEGCEFCSCDYWKGEQMATEAEGEMSPYPRCTCPPGHWGERNRIPHQRHQQSCPCWPSMTPPDPQTSPLDALVEEVMAIRLVPGVDTDPAARLRQAIRDSLVKAQALVRAEYQQAADKKAEAEWWSRISEG